MKKPTICVVLSTLILLSFITSCKKTNSSTDPTPTAVFSLVGTWTISEAKVTINDRTTNLTIVDIARGTYPIDDLVFTADGKYTRGKESGTWELSTNRTELKLGNLTYEFQTNDNSLFQFGNTFNDFQAQVNVTDAKRNAISGSTALLNTSIPTATLNSIAYRVIYKKKG